MSTPIRPPTNFIYQTIQESYHSIHGESFPEKVKTIGLKTIQASAWIGAAYVLYPRIINIVETNSIIVSLGVNILSYAPILNSVYQGFFFLKCQNRFINTINLLKEPASISQRFIAIAILYALAYQMLFILRHLSHLSVENTVSGKDPIQTDDVLTLHDLSSLSQTLDDYGLTYWDYLILDFLFNKTNQDPAALKERVASYLYRKGLQSGDDFTRKQIIQPGSNRQDVMRNLTKYLESNETFNQNESFLPLPTIQKTQRVAAAAFNLLLTLGTLAFQLKYSWQTTLLGLGMGLFLRDVSIDYALKKQLKQLYKKINEVIEDNQLEQLLGQQNAGYLKSLPYLYARIFNNLLIYQRAEKTALFSPTQLGQKCRQIWESWRLVAHNITFPNSFNVLLAGAAQGQTLASYWKSYNAQTMIPSPTETLHSISTQSVD